MRRSISRRLAGLICAGSILAVVGCAPRGIPTSPGGMMGSPAANPAQTTAPTGQAAVATRTQSMGDGSTQMASPGSTMSYPVAPVVNVMVNCTPKVWDADRQAISTQVTITNDGDVDLDNAIVVVDSVSDGLTLANPDGYIDGKAYISYGHLAVGQTSSAKVWLWKGASSLVKYECMTHVEAMLAPSEANVEDTLTRCGVPGVLELVTDDTLRERLLEDFHGVLKLGLSEQDEEALYEHCKADLDELSDVDLRLKLVEKFRALLFYGFDCDNLLVKIDDAGLRGMLEEDLHEALQAQLNEQEVEQLRTWFLADIDQVTDWDLKTQLKSVFEAIMAFHEHIKLVDHDEDFDHKVVNNDDLHEAFQATLHENEHNHTGHH